MSHDHKEQHPHSSGANLDATGSENETIGFEVSLEAPNPHTNAQEADPNSHVENEEKIVEKANEVGLEASSADSNEKQSKSCGEDRRRRGPLDELDKINIASMIAKLPPLILTPQPKRNPSGPYGFCEVIPNELDKSSFPDHVLTKDDIKKAVSKMDVCFNANGKKGFGITQFNFRNQCISDISIFENFEHLQSINFVKNRITSLTPLAKNKHLTLVDLEANLISDPSNIPEIENLRILNLEDNRIESTEDFPLNEYIYLNISRNKLTGLDSLTREKFTRLLSLEIRGNAIKSFGCLDLPLLKFLWASQNELDSFDGLSGCPNLICIHLRNNKFSMLQSFPKNLYKLEYLNLRDNRIKKISQVRYLGRSPIKALILTGNLACNQNMYRLETLAFVITLIRLDKNFITTCGLKEARAIRRRRMKIQSTPSVADEVKGKQERCRKISALKGRAEINSLMQKAIIEHIRKKNLAAAAAASAPAPTNY